MEGLLPLASPNSVRTSGVAMRLRRSAGSLPWAPRSGTHGFLSPPTPTLVCSKRRGCCRSSPCCPTFSVHGSSSPCAPRRVLTTSCEPSRPTSPPAMRVATTMPSGDACSRCWAKKTTRIPRSLQHVGSRCCRLVWAAWACSAPSSVPPPQLTWPPGPTHCPSCARAAPTLLPGASQNSLQVRLLLPPACALPKRLAVHSKVPDGRFPRLLYPLSPATPCPGHAAFAVRAARSRVAQCHPERGWLHSAARPHAHSIAAAAAVAPAGRSTQIWHTVTVVAPLSTPTPRRVPSNRLAPSNMPGCASRAKLWDPRAR